MDLMITSELNALEISLGTLNRIFVEKLTLGKLITTLNSQIAQAESEGESPVGGVKVWLRGQLRAKGCPFRETWSFYGIEKRLGEHNQKRMNPAREVNITAEFDFAYERLQSFTKLPEELRQKMAKAASVSEKSKQK